MSTQNHHEYRLGSSKWANSTLNLQHLLILNAFDGELLDPQIPCTAPNLKIADICCGAGIWLASLKVHETAQLYGLDLKRSGLPPAQSLPNTHAAEYNVFRKPPEMYLEYFDIINVQLTLTFVGDEDIAQAFDNILSMLKPGGWLQWTELDPNNQELYRPNTGQVIEYLDKMWPECWNLYDSHAPRWPSTLDHVFDQFHLTAVKKVKPRPSDRMLHARTEQQFVAYNETLETFQRLSGGSSDSTRRADRFQELIERSRVEFETTKSGVWIPIVSLKDTSSQHRAWLHARFDRQALAAMAVERQFSLQDVGIALEGIQTHQSQFFLRPAVLFHSTALSQASSEQNHHLREGLGITTILDTTPAKDFKAESRIVTHVLGVTHCRIQLRDKTFARDLLDQQPSWKAASFSLRADLAALRPHTKQRLIKEAEAMAMKRNVVDEGIAILKAASKSGLVKYLFNELLAANAGAFPLLISGDVEMRDSLIVLFLLLVMLGFDGVAIQRVVLLLQGADDTTGNFMELLKKRFDAEYGSTEHFFHDCAGVTRQAASTIRGRMLITPVKEQLESLLD
ncbi:hypothetical protein PRZ48_000047 [Zasmidium cellare]|uniref:Methyltransferase domain-containing protein n=1 Tax=Zasmidium cellare TaxID=395010 RepID=A0ABR0EXT0_ZASCE|nr:hypothetical protein PRZ48_000047 [Zasmidium cellare]